MLNLQVYGILYKKKSKDVVRLILLLIVLICHSTWFNICIYFDSVLDLCQLSFSQTVIHTSQVVFPAVKWAKGQIFGVGLETHNRVTFTGDRASIQVKCKACTIPCQYDTSAINKGKVYILQWNGVILPIAHTYHINPINPLIGRYLFSTHLMRYVIMSSLNASKSVNIVVTP